MSPNIESYIIYSLISTHESTTGMTPSLAALGDAPSLKQREWI